MASLEVSDVWKESCITGGVGLGGVPCWRYQKVGRKLLPLGVLGWKICLVGGIRRQNCVAHQEIQCIDCWSVLHEGPSAVSAECYRIPRERPPAVTQNVTSCLGSIPQQSLQNVTASLMSIAQQSLQYVT